MRVLFAALREKYAEDTSLGVPINDDKVQILKDKLILIYDRLIDEIYRLPAYKEIAENEFISASNEYQEFVRLIVNLTNYVAENDLYHIFNYAIKLIDKLNALANSLPRSGLPREEVLLLDGAIKRIQQTIYFENKKLINIHDLKGTIPDFPELSRILKNAPVPTWQYGPGNLRDFVQPRIRQRFDRAKDLIKRLEKEMKEEEAAKNKGKTQK
jgi:hypothetical protein